MLSFFADCWIVFVSLLLAMPKFFGKDRQVGCNGGDYSKLIVKVGLGKHQFARWKEAIVPPNLPRISKFGGTFSFRNHFLNSQTPG